MLKPSEIERLSITMDKPMRRLENEIMSDIIRRIKENGGEISRAADWQIYRLHELGMAQEDINNAIQSALNYSDEEMQEMYRNVIAEGYAYDSKLYKAAGVPRVPFEDNLPLQQLINAVGTQTASEFKNYTQSLGFAIRNPNGTITYQPIATYYQQALDNAVMGIASGVFDYNTVINKTVAEMTNSGLRTVDYASGWSNRIDVAVRRAIMAGLSQITAKVNESNANELGTDTYEVSWHSGARPSHQVWQGKWYTHQQLIDVCGLGTVTGLCGANCYHDYYPVIPGISEPTYTAEELRRMNAEENKKTEFRGKEYTKYEALQRQRKLETTMRAQRQKIRLLEEGGADEDDILAAKARYRATSHEYAELSKATGLPQQRQRVYVDGLGNVTKNKYVNNSGKTSLRQIQPVELKYKFTEAKTIEEAQTYAQQFCKDEFMAKNFKGVDYKGISIENANAINKALTDVYNKVDLDKISGIKAVSPSSTLGKKAFKSGSDAVFAYDPIQHGIYINKDVLKNEKSFAEYLKRSEDSWNTVMDNIDKLSGNQKELAITYKNAGRSLVNGQSVEGLFTHELGHHAQWTLLDAKTNNSVGGKMSKYAPKISGYANASKGEYLAESFAAYIKGEKSIIDPEYVKYIDLKLIDKSAKSGIINTGAISGALNPYSKAAEEHAIQYYESVRHMKTDTARIAKTTGISKDKIDKIKQHVFIAEHELEDGKHRFIPSYDMAQSWQRLINGTFEEKDIVLLKHEYAELRYMEKGLSQSKAHFKASKKYNYAKYCE